MIDRLWGRLQCGQFDAKSQRGMYLLISRELSFSFTGGAEAFPFLLLRVSQRLRASALKVQVSVTQTHRWRRHSCLLRTRQECPTRQESRNTM